MSFKKNCLEVARKIRNRTRVLRALSGSSWGACTDTLIRFYRSFVDPVCTYRIATWGNCAIETNLKVVETARNEGLRLASGLPKATKVVTLRELTGTISLRRLGALRAGRLIDQAVCHADTPLAETMRRCVPSPSSVAISPREAGMQFLASNGILSICRSKFPEPTSAMDRTNKFNTIYADTSKAETLGLQNKAALRAITAIRDNQPGGWEIWKDGSVTKTPLDWFHTI